MINSDFLSIYPQMQEGIIFDKLIDVQSSGAVIAYCQADPDPNWNFALVQKVLSEQEINNLEEEFFKLKRNSSIYFENKPELNSLQESLIRRGYKIAYEDSWMFYEPKSVVLPEGYNVLPVSNEDEIKVFLDTFRQCYQKDDPQNPYGEWGDGYLQTIADSWRKYHQTQKVECFIFYKDQDPVAVSELVSHGGIGYITNVGSVRQVRGEGFGKLATLHCVQRSMEKGNTNHFLLTEEEGFPHEFYQRLGFKTRFTAIDYKKEQGGF